MTAELERMNVLTNLGGALNMRVEELQGELAKMQEELPLMLREHLVPYASALYIQALLNDSEDDWDDDALGENDFRR